MDAASKTTSRPSAVSDNVPAFASIADKPNENLHVLHSMQTSLFNLTCLYTMQVLYYSVLLSEIASQNCSVFMLSVREPAGCLSPTAAYAAIGSPVPT